MDTATPGDLVINGERVPAARIAAEAQLHAAPRDRPDLAWRQAAQALTMRTLLLQEARRRGLAARPETLAPGRVETTDEASIRALLEAVVVVEPPSDTQVRAQWSKDPRRFTSPPLWEVSHILCAFDSSDAATGEAACARANALLDTLRDDPACFAALADRHSDCTSRSAGGTIGQIRPGDTAPAFEAAVRRLEVGETTAAPVLTAHGYHLIRLDARADGRTLPFEAVRAGIAEAMERAAWSRRAQAFARSLFAQATIEGAPAPAAATTCGSGRA